MRLPLRARFALLAAALVLLVASLVGVAGYLTLRHSLLARAAGTARIEAARLVGLIGASANGQGDSLDITDRSLTGQLSTPGLRVEIDRPSSAIVQSTGRQGPHRVVALSAGLRRQCLTLGAVEARTAHPPQQIACKRVGPRHAPLGTVAVAVPLSDAFGSLAALRRSLLLGVLGGSLLAALLSLAVAGRALRPLEKIATTAETIRSGDISRRVNYRGRDELGKLAGVLDACFEELEEAIERQRRFGADASHELKTPLAAIRANVELLRGWAGLDPLARETSLASLDQASRRASHLVGDLLQLAKLDRGLARARTLVSLDGVVLDAVREAGPLRFEVAIRVERLDEALVEGDPLGLGQLLLNLLDNALTVSPADGEVRISLARQERHASVTVTDSGPGIGAGELERIFDRFYSKKISTPPRASAGLGLAIARAIADEHGGKLSATNQPAGGASFELTLPLASAPSRPAGPARSPAYAAETGSPAGA